MTTYLLAVGTKKGLFRLEGNGDGFEITKVHLTVNAKIPGATDAKFQELANMAEE